MAVGRRGVVFTLIAVIVSALLVALLSAPKADLSAHAMETVSASTRVSLMNSFITTVEQHASQSLTTAGYFLLRRMSEKIHSEVAFIADLNGTVSSCLVNNTIDYLGSSVTCLNASHQVNTSLDTLSQLARSELAIAFEFEIHDAWVTEENPMEMLFWLNFSYNVSDAFADWQVVGHVINTPVSAEAVHDPFYEWMYASGETTERRNFSLTEFRPTQFNLDVFNLFYNNQSYIIWQGASPSLVQRYLGETGHEVGGAPSVCCGVESVALRSNLTGVTGDYGNYSMTDHQLVAHLRGILPVYNCELGEVRKLRRDAPGGGDEHLSLHWYTFDNPYNLSNSLDHVPDCTWP